MNTDNNGQAVHGLNEIISIARDGHGIYAKAVAGVQSTDPQLSALMMRMAASKTKVVTELTTLVRRAGGQPALHGTLGGQLRGGFGWFGTVLGDAGIQYVSESHAAEARLVRAMEVAVHNRALSGQARRTLGNLLLETRLCWDDMRQQLTTLRERDP